MRRVVRLALPMIPLLALVAVGPLGVRAESRRKTEIRRVVVIHLDTTRVNDLSCYGGISRTPNIDAVAARGMRYTNSIAPVTHGGGLQQALTTLAENLDGHGYVNGVPKTTVAEALRFVDEHRFDRFFLWMLAGHEGEVTQTDRRIGVLLDRLDDLPGRTLLIITADHGESPGDAGKWLGHGDTIRHTGVNVPLVVACDGVVPIGVSDALVANVDLAPTIFDLLDLPVEALGADGRSLVPTFEESDPWPQRLVPNQALDGSGR